MSISYKTPDYFSSFSCLGGDCEDTCCRNWDVKLDRQHYDLLKNVTLEDEQLKFEQYIHLNNNTISSDRDYAFIGSKDDGYCSMLDTKGLCSVQSKYGENYLGDVCTMFPRIISRCGDVFELSGSLSCPEVVRKCISQKILLKLRSFKPADLPRSKNYPIQRELSNLENDFYSESFSIVRQSLMQIIANEEQDLETRLYLLVNFTHTISSFYHRDCKKADVEQLENIFSSQTESKFVAKMDEFITDYDAGSPISMIVVHSVLSIKLQQAGNENISLLYKKIITEYGCENQNIAEVLAENLEQTVNNLDQHTKQYIDKALTRYILNCLYREWFTSMPDPFTYVQMLLVRMAILKTLIYLDVGYKKELSQTQLEERVVYIMYNFARNIDQNLEFLKVVFNALSEQTMMNFDFSPAFIRIY